MHILNIKIFSHPFGQVKDCDICGFGSSLRKHPLAVCRLKSPFCSHRVLNLTSNELLTRYYSSRSFSHAEDIGLVSVHCPGTIIRVLGNRQHFLKITSIVNEGSFSPSSTRVQWTRYWVKHVWECHFVISKTLSWKVLSRAGVEHRQHLVYTRRFIGFTI